MCTIHWQAPSPPLCASPPTGSSQRPTPPTRVWHQAAHSTGRAWAQALKPIMVARGGQHIRLGQLLP
ncbi:hypothetical protein BD779DRAFT_1567006 [Infundibulicybe gibba]|nr:hypothetical protein BD779DRAFT_1567006 [Infundibulicybe gibba]